MTSPLLSSKAWFIEKHLGCVQHTLKSSAEKLLLISDYASRYVHLLISLLEKDACTALLNREDYFNAIASLDPKLTQTQFSQALRHFRHAHFLRLLLLEIAGIASTEQVMRSWSDCADSIILHTLNHCYYSLSSRYGAPLDEQGKPVELFVLAMGKLGGRELNYSSDIDLIFTYTSSGYTPGEEIISNEMYFSKVIQQLVQLLQSTTPEGFVFRVDLRLRPNGDSGPLVLSLSAMETYYQEQGRDWERYAMVKARVVTPSLTSPSWFNRLIIPFVYRRYVDFSVIESLRGMKALIEREVQLNPRLDDIKRGRGGIREVEFIIQNFQLIRGGRLPQLQQQNALLALDVLRQEELLPRGKALKQAYLFLRRLENVLQSINDQQTHSLPEDELRKTQIILALAYDTWEDFLTRLHQYQRIISNTFHSLLATENLYTDQQRLLSNQLLSLWQGHIEECMAVNLLASLGFKNAAHCFQMLHSFRHGPRCRRLSQAARLRLDRFMVLVLSELVGFEHKDEVLLQIMHLLDQIVGRSAYLALVTENPHILKELFFWFSESPFITNLLVNQPFLLEVLLDQEEDWKPLSLKKLEQKLRECLSHSTDLELQEEVLRQFKLTHWLMAARAEWYGLCDAVRIGKFLSDLAQVIVAEVFSLACRHLSLDSSKITQIRSYFAIIAYGTFGSREMNYASDVDLVFLHQVPATEEALVTRLTQKILHMLTIRTQTGILYAVDTRLRPSGSAGLLVSRIDAFIEYQKKQAWTWEHQALLKARIIIGPPQIKRAFMELKKSLLSLVREEQALKQEIIAMRAKINLHLEPDPIKHQQGGLLDLEFLIQFLLLNKGQAHFFKFTHTLSFVKQLFLAQVIDRTQMAALSKAYKYYHRLLHQNILQPKVSINKLVINQNIQMQVKDLVGVYLSPLS